MRFSVEVKPWANITSFFVAFLFCLSMMCFVHVVSVGAEIVHKFIPPPIEDVPASASLPGYLEGVNAMTVDSGNLWVAEKKPPGYRVDEFDADSGGFIAQLPQPSPASNIHELDSGIAVSHLEGEEQVYVGGINETSGGPEGSVEIFTKSGPGWNLVNEWDGNDTPAKAFGRRGVRSIAVDASVGGGSDWAAGDVYVVDSGEFDGITPIPQNEHVVDVFRPEVGGGEKYIGQLTGAGLGELFSDPRFVAVDSGTGDVVVMDERGPSVYTGDIFRPGPSIGEWEFLGHLAGPSNLGMFSAGVGGVAIDPATGHIYVSGARDGVVYEFDSTGERIGVLTGKETPTGSLGGNGPAGLAIDSKSENLFVGNQRQNEPGSVYRFGPDVVIPDVSTGFSSNEKFDPSSHSWSVRLNGSVDPAKAGTASCLFDWGLSSSFGQQAPCSREVTELESQQDGGFVPVHSSLSGLAPDTTYHYRLQASNTNGTNQGEGEETFTTRGPGLHGQSVSHVTSSSATFEASIDPHESTPSPSTYFFEYGPTTSYGSNAPAFDSTAPFGGIVGAGPGDVDVSQHVQGLTGAAIYHYRLVVFSEVEPEHERNPGLLEREIFYGPDRTFTTQNSDISKDISVLQDGRKWELVSPVNKHGGVIYGLAESTLEGLIQSAVNGDKFTFVTASPIDKQPEGYSDFEGQALASHGADGWSSRYIATAHGLPVELRAEREYRMFSPDLSVGLVEPRGPFTALSDEASEQTPYVRRQKLCNDLLESSQCYEPLVTASYVPGDTLFGGEVKVAGASEDESHVVLESAVKLTATPIIGTALYEWSENALQDKKLILVSALPESENADEHKPTVGITNVGINTRHAVSSDGSRIVWSEHNGGEHLFVRDVGLAKTLQLDVPQSGVSGGSGPPLFQAADRGVTRVFFLDGSRLTSDSSLSGKDLYECRIVEESAELKCDLTDLTPEAGGERSNVQSAVMGISDDGSYLYFVANGVMSGGQESGAGESAISGAFNLYVLHYDDLGDEWEKAHLIGVLSGGEEFDWDGNSNGTFTDLTHVTSRVSPDGRFFAFMSSQPLTGYDNRDVVSDQPDEEVYIYDASTGKLACASCNPTGGRPIGIENGAERRLVSSTGVLLQGTWFAANVPGWTPLEAKDSFYQSRYLSNSGRLFFNSSDALVPADVNHGEDVYEFELPGVGDCRESSHVFSRISGGCVSLISSGLATGESAFLDASESGDDVFFLTGERLVSKDVDTALDVYDAHVCGAGWDCASEPVEPPECVTADACRAAPLLQPGVFGAPAGATFKGAGNLVPPPGGKTRPKALTRSQKLTRALGVCKKKKTGSRRVSCERSARKRYGPRPGAKKTRRKRSVRSTVNTRRASVTHSYRRQPR